MDILSNNEWQFIISTCIGILGIGIGIWIARKPVQIPISHSEIAIDPIVGSEYEIKELLEKMEVPAVGETITYPCFVTLKIWNSGSESVTLPEDSKPLSIAFNRGERILDCEVLDTFPDDLELTYKLKAEKILLNFPLLDPKQWIIFKVLLSNYVNYFPKVEVRVPGKKRIKGINNVRMSKQLMIGALFFLGVAIYSFMSFSFGQTSYTHTQLAEFSIVGLSVFSLLVSLLLFLESLVSRKSAPFSYSVMLPSTMLFIYFKLFLYALPVLIITGTLAGIIYVFFGSSILKIVFLIFCCLFASFGMWYWLKTGVFYVLRKTKKTFHSWVINIVAGLPSIVFLGFCVYIFVNLFQYR